MEQKEAVDIKLWRKVVELGNGRTGTVALYVEPIPLGSDKKIRPEPVIHAVKKVERQSVGSVGAARRVFREKTALQSLRGHPGIVDLRFTSKDDQNLYFVFEPFLGGPLHKHIRAGPSNRLEESVARFYASEMTSAIAHLHAHLFVHRDLKASNAVLCASGHVKLVDFGCAKQLSQREKLDDGSGASLEKTYTYCGTPHCMAPEMVSKEGHGLAVDWWALGVLIHEMLAGEPPFGYGGDRLQEKIIAGLPKPKDEEERALGEDDGDVEAAGVEESERREDGRHVPPEAFQAIVRRLLDTDSQQRLGGSSGGAEDVMAHAWFSSVNWATTARFEITPPSFRKDLGDLDALDGELESAEDADPSGAFAGF